MSGLILIALGIIFLLTNFGLVSWSIFGFLWHFWPVLLILAGLKMMASGSQLGRALVEIITVFAVAYILLYALFITSPVMHDTFRSLTPYFPHNQLRQFDQFELHMGNLTSQ